MGLCCLMYNIFQMLQTMHNLSKGQKGTSVKNMCNNLCNNAEMICHKKRKEKMTKSIQLKQQLKKEAYK